MTTERSSTATVVDVRPLGPADVAFAADLHARCLPDGFFAVLGPGFLRAYYASFARSPWARCFLAEVDGCPAGTAVGVLDGWPHYRFVIRRFGWRLGPVAVAALAARPRLAGRFVRTRGRRYARGLVRLVRRRDPVAQRGAGGGPAGGGGEPEAVLAHLAVSPRFRRHGVGTALVEAVTAGARAAGVARLRLLAPAGDAGVRHFYETLGWQETGRVVDADGKPWARYVRPA